MNGKEYLRIHLFSLFIILSLSRTFTRCPGPLKILKNLLIRDGQRAKLWKAHTPGTRIGPPKSGDKDKKWQLRFDAEEVKDGKKRIYLQVNSQASNDAFQKWKKKNTSHGNLVFGDINPDGLEDNIPEAFDEFWQGIEKQAKDSPG